MIGWTNADKQPDGAPGPLFQRPSETSRAAAREISPHAESLRGSVLALLRSLSAAGKGATDEQIAETLRMSPNTERPRRIELVRMGCVIDSGERALTKAGRKAVVWTIAPRGA